LNFKRILNFAAAAAAVAAAVAVCVVAASFAIYAFAKVYVGSAWAAAIVAAVFAVVALIFAGLSTRKVSLGRPGGKVREAGLADRLVALAKERPLLALGATAAAVVVLARNPAMITAVVSAFVAGSAAKSGK
jgi:hypothetical protein